MGQTSHLGRVSAIAQDARNYRFADSSLQRLILLVFSVVLGRRMRRSNNAPETNSGPGWISDPNDAERLRYWNSQTWTDYGLAKPEGWGAGRRMRWWQTWWEIVLGLILVLPLGLVGL